MSHGPSTLGIMITASLSPISETTVVRSSRIQGDSRLLTRVHSWVSPRSISLPTRTSPARAASLRSTGTASSRLPSRMSTVGAMSGTLATIFSLEKSRKWIIREGLNGISSTGSGAPMASGLGKARGVCLGRAGWLGWVSEGGACPRTYLTFSRRMNQVDTDQTTREASGAHPYGRYLEEFEVGAVYKHWPAKTVTESDDHLFCLI